MAESGVRGILIQEQVHARVVNDEDGVARVQVQRTLIRGYRGTSPTRAVTRIPITESSSLVSRDSVDSRTRDCPWPFLCSASFFPVCMIVLGSVYFHDCPGEWKIPLIPIIEGVMTFVLCLLYAKHMMMEEKSNLFKGIMILLGLCTFTWSCLGCYWTYPLVGTVRDQTENDFCNKVVFWTTFSVVTLPLAVPALICICACCFGMSA